MFEENKCWKIEKLAMYKYIMISESVILQSFTYEKYQLIFEVIVIKNCGLVFWKVTKSI